MYQAGMSGLLLIEREGGTPAMVATARIDSVSRALTPDCRRRPMTATDTLTDLVRAARDGDAGAWSRIIERHTALLWSVARAHRLDSHSAADVVQTTWLRLVDSLDRIEQPEALPGWLATTARREALRIVLRSRDVPGWGQDVAEDLDRRSNAADLDAHLLSEERDAVLWTTFNEQTERCQRLLRILCADQSPPYSVISTMLGMPVGSIGPTRARCLTQLRAALATTGYDFSREGDASR